MNILNGFIALWEEKGRPYNSLYLFIEIYSGEFSNTYRTLILQEEARLCKRN